MKEVESFYADYTRHGKARDLEKAIPGFRFKGPGWYLEKMGVLFS